MNPLEKLKSALPKIEHRLGYTFKNKDLVLLAFVHRSFINEHPELVKEHNERLEFLGDSVLGLLISEYLYKYLPSTPEGELSFLRSRLVEASSCLEYMEKMKLEEHVLLGRGERFGDRRGRDSILADLFESLLGAIYLDGGIDAARRHLFKNFSPEIDRILKQPVRNWKAQLQDFAQKTHQQTPRYRVINEEGPDHAKMFWVAVLIDGSEVGRGKGGSKKEAQQAAAAAALKVLEQGT